jgi:predicted MFS family arabinose efflux permease
LLVVGLSNTQTAGWTAPSTLSLLVGAAIVLAGFVAVETRVTHPLVPLRVFRSGAVSSFVAVMFLISGAMNTMVLLLSLHLSQVLGYSGIRSGVAFVPLGCILVGAAVIMPRFITRAGARPVVVAGVLIFAAALLLLRGFPMHGSYAFSLLPGMVLLGIGVNAALLAGTIAVLGGRDDADQGLMSGLVNTSQQVGGAMGVAVFGTIAAGRSAALTAPGILPAPGALASGYSYAATLTVGVVALALLVVLGVPRLTRLLESGPAPQAGDG